MSKYDALWKYVSKAGKNCGRYKKNADRLVVLINDIIRLSRLDHSEVAVSVQRKQKIIIIF